MPSRERGEARMSVVALRLVDDSDLDPLFEQMRDPVSVRMAAFTTKDPNGRNAEIEETVLRLD